MSTKKKYYLEVNARSEKSLRLRNGVGSSKKSLKFYLLNTSFISLTACNSKKIKEPIENIMSKPEIEKKIIPDQRYINLYQTAYESFKQGHSNLRGLQ